MAAPASAPAPPGQAAGAPPVNPDAELAAMSAVPPQREANFSRKPGFDYRLVTVTFTPGAKFGLVIKSVRNMVIVSKIEAGSMCAGPNGLRVLDHIIDVNGIVVSDKEVTKQLIVKNLKETRCTNMIVARPMDDNTANQIQQLLNMSTNMPSVELRSDAKDIAKKFLTSFGTNAKPAKGIMTKPGEKQDKRVRLSDNNQVLVIATDLTVRDTQLQKVPEKRPVVGQPFNPNQAKGPPQSPQQQQQQGPPQQGPAPTVAGSMTVQAPPPNQGAAQPQSPASPGQPQAAPGQQQAPPGQQQAPPGQQQPAAAPGPPKSAQASPAPPTQAPVPPAVAAPPPAAGAQKSATASPAPAQPAGAPKSGMSAPPQSVKSTAPDQAKSVTGAAPSTQKSAAGPAPEDDVTTAKLIMTPAPPKPTAEKKAAEKVEKALPSKAPEKPTAEKPAEKPADKAAEKPAEKAVEKPAEKAAEKPAAEKPKEAVLPSTPVDKNVSPVHAGSHPGGKKSTEAVAPVGSKTSAAPKGDHKAAKIKNSNENTKEGKTKTKESKDQKSIEDKGKNAKKPKQDKKKGKSKDAKSKTKGNASTESRD